MNYLGEGGYGKVYKVKHKLTGQYRAMKIIKCKSSSKNHEKQIKKEIQILKTLDHPNILKVYEFFCNENTFFIINELCTGGELFDKIIEVKHFSESVAANIMRQIFSAIAFCHSQGIIHRDLKPENILIESYLEKNSKFFHIKVIDFGTCEILKKNKMLKEQIGTSFYIAPDVLKNEYNEKCDLWSCGVIMYILLCGTPPFFGINEEEIYRKILNCNFTFRHKIWNEISQEGKDLINNLLQLNPNKRLSAIDALNHPWFKLFNNEKINNKKLFNEKNLISIIKNISEFRIEQKLQQATLAFLVHNLSSQEELFELKEIFCAFDKNCDGRLTKEELHEGLNKIYHVNNIKSSLECLMKTIDTDNNGFIEFEEFVRVCINKEKLLTEKNLKIAFDLFDRDKNGAISCSELKYVLGEFNGRVKESVWRNMINEIDLNGDGEISFEEFKTMMNNVILKDKKKYKNNLIDDNYINNCYTFPYNKVNYEMGFKGRYDMNDTFNENRDTKKTCIMINKKLINKQSE